MLIRSVYGCTVVDDNTEHAIVTDSGKNNGIVVGAFSGPTYVRNVLAGGLDLFNTPVQDVMDASPLTCTSSHSYVTICECISTAIDLPALTTLVMCVAWPNAC